MASDLNSVQFGVLQWVADGCPDGVYEGYSHRVSAAALRARRYVTTKGKGSTWSAKITRRGVDALAAASERPPEPEPPRPIRATVPVPESLKGSHPLVRASRKEAAGAPRDDCGRLFIAPGAGGFRMVVSRELLRPALLVAQAICDEAPRRGFAMSEYEGSGDVWSGAAVVVRDHRYPVEIHEITETLDFTQEEIDAWRNEWPWGFEFERRKGRMPPPQKKRRRATGHLRIVLPEGLGRQRVWSGGARGSVERKLPKFFDDLAEQADRDDAWELEMQRWRDAQANEAAAHQERLRVAAEEDRLNEVLAAQVTAFERARSYRSYADALVASLSAEVGESDQTLVVEWADRALRRATVIDPTGDPVAAASVSRTAG